MNSTQTAYNQSFDNETQQDFSGPVSTVWISAGMMQIYGLNFAQCGVISYIDGLSNTENFSYCVMFIAEIARIWGVSRQFVYDTIHIGIEKKILEKAKTGRGIRTTKKWRDQKKFEQGKLENKRKKCQKNGHFQEEKDSEKCQKNGQECQNFGFLHKENNKEKNSEEFSSLIDKAEKALIREFDHIPKYVSFENPHRVTLAIRLYMKTKQEKYQGPRIFKGIYNDIQEDYEPPSRSATQAERSKTPVEEVNADIDKTICEMRKSENIEFRDMAIRLDMERPLTSDIDTVTQFRDNVLREYGQEKIHGLRAAFA